MASSNDDNNSKKSGKSLGDSIVEGAGKTIGAALVIGAFGFVLSGGNPAVAAAAFQAALQNPTA